MPHVEIDVLTVRLPCARLRSWCPMAVLRNAGTPGYVTVTSRASRVGKLFVTVTKPSTPTRCSIRSMI